MRLSRTAAALLAAAALLGACGDDSDEPAETGDTPTTTSTTEPETTTSAPEEQGTTSTEGTGEGELQETAEAAAEAFLALLFPDATATVGELREGDPTSGEIDVLRPAEGGGTANVAATLLVRNEGDGWRVIGAVSEGVTIGVPENASEVAAGPLTVSGTGRGFEGALVARAVAADGTVLDQQAGQGGSMAELEPYELTLDLSGAEPGSQVWAVVNGGTGLEGDPGEFAAVLLTVAG